MSQAKNKKAAHIRVLIWSLAVAMMILALARPQWGTKEETVKVSGLDILFAVDISNSMLVEDIIPSRIQKAKHLIRNFVGRLKGDRVGIVAFAGSSYLACPLTTDIGYVEEITQTLGPEMLANQGTDIGIALETLTKALDRGAELGQEEDLKTHSGSRVAILISDGEDLEQSSLAGAELIKKAGIQFFVLGVGTEAGGKIPTRDSNGMLRGFKIDDKTRKEVVSQFHPDALLKIAEAGQGRYWTVTAQEDEVEEILKDIGALNRNEFSERKYLVYEERFQYPLFIAVLLILIELFIPLRKMTAVALLLLLSTPSFADTAVGSYFKNKKAMQLYSEGKLDEAGKLFNEESETDPTEPIHPFNQGVVEIQKKSPDKAIEKFLESKNKAEKAKNPGQSARSSFNLGSALEGKKDLPSAIDSFVEAIDRAKLSGDKSLVEDAQKRLEKLVEQQKDEDKKDEDKGKDGDAQKKQDQKDQKEGDKDKGEKEKDRQYGQQKFQSQKITKDDAERVMSELLDREKQLQSKLKKQVGKADGRHKDW